MCLFYGGEKLENVNLRAHLTGLRLVNCSHEDAAKRMFPRQLCSCFVARQTSESKRIWRPCAARLAWWLCFSFTCLSSSMITVRPLRDLSARKENALLAPFFDAFALVDFMKHASSRPMSAPSPNRPNRQSQSARPAHHLANRIAAKARQNLTRAAPAEPARMALLHLPPRRAPCGCGVNPPSPITRHMILCSTVPHHSDRPTPPPTVFLSRDFSSPFGFLLGELSLVNCYKGTPA